MCHSLNGGDSLLPAHAEDSEHQAVKGCVLLRSWIASSWHHHRRRQISWCWSIVSPMPITCYVWTPDCWWFIHSCSSWTIRWAGSLLYDQVTGLATILWSWPGKLCGLFRTRSWPSVKSLEVLNWISWRGGSRIASNNLPASLTNLNIIHWGPWITVFFSFWPPAPQKGCPFQTNFLVLYRML